MIYPPATPPIPSPSPYTPRYNPFIFLSLINKQASKIIKIQTNKTISQTGIKGAKEKAIETHITQSVVV